jgi:hypothetical protein
MPSPGRGRKAADGVAMETMETFIARGRAGKSSVGRTEAPVSIFLQIVAGFTGGSIPLFPGETPPLRSETEASGRLHLADQFLLGFRLLVRRCTGGSRAEEQCKSDRGSHDTPHHQVSFRNIRGALPMQLVAAAQELANQNKKGAEYA